MRCLFLVFGIVVAVNAAVYYPYPAVAHPAYPQVTHSQHVNTHGGITHIHPQHPYYQAARPHQAVRPVGQVTNSQLTNAHHGSQAHNSQLTNVRRPGANVHNSQLTNSVHGAHVTNTQVTNLHNTLGYVTNSQVSNH